jgi:hypothetical protein
MLWIQLGSKLFKLILSVALSNCFHVMCIGIMILVGFYNVAQRNLGTVLFSSHIHYNRACDSNHLLNQSESTSIPSLLIYVILWPPSLSKLLLGCLAVSREEEWFCVSCWAIESRLWLCSIYSPDSVAINSSQEMIVVHDDPSWSG